MSEARTLFERLAEARARFQEEADFRKVSGDGLRFPYLPIEQAKPVIERVTAACGLTILPLSLELDDSGSREWDKASKYSGEPTHWIQLRGTVRFRIACGTGPDDSIDMDITAEAMDNSDKALSKLYTMAYKSMVKIVFGFAESPKDDPDATQEEIPAKAPAKPAPKRGQTASPCFSAESVPHSPDALISLPLDLKIEYTKAKTRQFVLAVGGPACAYVSYSGGKDSTVLLHLVRSIWPEIPAVYIDTGLEFPEVRTHAMSTDGVVVIRPAKSFREVIRDHGYPLVSKEVAKAVDSARRGLPSGLARMADEDGRYGYARYAYLVDAPFSTSEKCCGILKKRPAHIYHKTTGRCPIIGTRATESRNRMDQWKAHGENRMGQRVPSSNPLSCWTESDIYAYIDRWGLRLPKPYPQGYKSTGCIFCGFGITCDRNRFVRLKSTHPRLWEYCMRPWGEGGLGMEQVLDYMCIPTGMHQTTLADWGEV